MDATVAVAALGFGSTLLAAWLTARWQTRGLVATELVTARVAAYGDCAEALYELERVSFDRALHKPAASEDEDAKRAQLVYEQNSRTRAAIGRLAILSQQSEVWKQLNELRRSIREMHDLPDEAALRLEHRRVIDALEAILAEVRDQFDDFRAG